jgi:hypothetical protein
MQRAQRQAAGGQSLVDGRDAQRNHAAPSSGGAPLLNSCDPVPQTAHQGAPARELPSKGKTGGGKTGGGKTGGGKTGGGRRCDG